VSHPNVPVWKNASIQGLAYHEHLYTRVVAAGETDEFEKWLAKEFEAPAEEPIRRAVSGERLSPDDWECLIRFMAAQDVRTPARLMETLSRWKDTLPEMVQTTLVEAVKEFREAKWEGRTLERTASAVADYFPSRIRTEIEPSAENGILKLETVAGRSLWLFGLRHLLTNTLQVLLRHRWTLLRPPIGMKWVTSDDPVVKLNYYGPEKYDFKGGWGSEGTEILFPLSPEHLLYTRIGHRPVAKYLRVSESMAEAFQRFTVEHAHRFVFAVDQDPFVPVTRPRVVDAVQFKTDADQWKRWHEEQANAERDLHKP
jgi:hypothetical protein